MHELQAHELQLPEQQVQEQGDMMMVVWLKLVTWEVDRVVVVVVERMRLMR